MKLEVLGASQVWIMSRMLRVTWVSRLRASLRASTPLLHSSRIGRWKLNNEWLSHVFIIKQVIDYLNVIILFYLPGGIWAICWHQPRAVHASTSTRSLWWRVRAPRSRFQWRVCWIQDDLQSHVRNEHPKIKPDLN